MWIPLLQPPNIIRETKVSAFSLSVETHYHPERKTTVWVKSSYYYFLDEKHSHKHRGDSHPIPSPPHTHYISRMPEVVLSCCLGPRQWALCPPAITTYSFAQWSIPSPASSGIQSSSYYLLQVTKLGLGAGYQGSLEKNKAQSIQVLYGLLRLVRDGEGMNDFPQGKLR